MKRAGPLSVATLLLASAAIAACTTRVSSETLPDASQASNDSGTTTTPDDSGTTTSPPDADSGTTTPPADSGPTTPPDPDSGPSTTPTDSGPTTPPASVISIGGCDAESATCTCTDLGPPNACTHTYGGVYANLGCSGGYQCCDGAFRKGLNVCGTCVCTDTTGEQGCTADDDATALCHPKFQGTAMNIPAAIREEMTGLSWKPDLECPAFSELRLLRLSHWTFDGTVAEGELVVNASVADEMLQAFEALFDARFPIERMERVDAYGADDDASMAANNTSAFNCRLTTSGTRLSEHSYGKAIDINPLNNPYVTGGGTVYPPAGSAFTDRTNVRKGMVVEPGPVVDAFDAIGWGWGGRWSSSKDYQHFSENGL